MFSDPSLARRRFVDGPAGTFSAWPNIESDPAEATNRYETDRDRAKELEASLENWRKTMRRTQSRRAAELTAEEIERLKSLGYVQ